MLDDEHPKLQPAPGDDNDYMFGTIGTHKVVIACLPAGMTGTVNAAVVAKDMMRSFPIRIGLMVGIAGGVWSEERDVRLGDVIVSQPNGQHGGVVQWDFGKMETGGDFRRTGTLNKPPRLLLNAVQGLQSRHKRKGNELHAHLEKMLLENPAMEESGYVHQGRDNDELFEASYDHQPGRTCGQCDRLRVVQREQRKSERPKIHYGNIASGDKVIKDGATRDRIAREEDVIAFEMEAAGLMDSYPCVVIRGICDYSDTHKNKRWQEYAAASAAAYAKELLLYMPASDVAQIRTANEATASASRRIIHVPFPKNYDFVGRHIELATLERRLFVDRDCQTMAVFGLGGMGKTQIVLRLAYDVAAQRPDTSIFWIPALSTETFSRAMKEMADLLGIRAAPDGNPDSLLMLVKQRLSSSYAGKWLLIVDNADDMKIVDGLREYLPISDTGMTVFTTRTADVAQRVARSDVLKIGKPDEDEAGQLLRKALANPEGLENDATSTSELLVELDYLPLAITQAAAYLNINDIAISEYVRLLRSTADDVIYLMSAEIDDNTRYKQSASAIATTWTVSFQQILKQDSIAAELLQFISCIEWKAIPYSMLPVVKPEARTRTAVGTLCSYSFLSRRADGTTYDMHRLVHLASRIWLREEGRTAEIQVEATKHVAKIFPTDDYTNRFLWRAYMPHAAQTRSYWLSQNTTVDIAKDGGEVSELSYKVGRCLLKDGRTRDSVQWLQEADDKRSKLTEESIRTDSYRSTRLQEHTILTVKLRRLLS
ncbi:TPR repeat protein [Dissoconium aciculare CBS 342.82]|uniref:TPR repeat protein n=1 Tax=Dissoconium aciculare CBS 342.82 TaxID=1314786 RepID=A0A6J3MAR2_9PEZI|nr:TPR repeat protein [Dissoconium aciculare CBS 342.82]KAF1823917.1 TPR repeat protein [Dissoconium aciculare CBS 342.82]